MTNKEWIELSNALEPHIRALDRIVREHKLDDVITVALGGNSISWMDFRDADESGEYHLFDYTMHTNGTAGASKDHEMIYRKG